MWFTSLDFGLVARTGVILVGYLLSIEYKKLNYFIDWTFISKLIGLSILVSFNREYRILLVLAGTSFGSGNIFTFGW